MKKQLFGILFFIVLAVGVSFAQPQPPVAPADPTAVVLADVSAVPVENTPTVGEAVVDTAKAVPSIIDQIKIQLDDKSAGKIGWLMALVAILSIIFKFLLSALKKFSPYVAKNKTLLRVLPLVLGLLVLILDKFIVGGAWWEAILVGISGPSSIMVHELIQIVIPKKV